MGLVHVVKGITFTMYAIENIHHHPAFQKDEIYTIKISRASQKGVLNMIAQENVFGNYENRVTY